MYIVQCTLCIVQYSMYNVQCTTYIVLRAMANRHTKIKFKPQSKPHNIMYTVQCTVYTVQCTVYSVHYTLYSIQHQDSRYIIHCTSYAASYVVRRTILYERLIIHV